MGKLTATKKAIANALDMSREARMARAREMGMDTDTVLYHGTVRDFEKFERKGKRHRSMGGHALGGREINFFTDNPQVAGGFAKDFRARPKGGDNVIPTVQNPGRQLLIDAGGEGWQKQVHSINEAYDSGLYDSVLIRNVSDNAESGPVSNVVAQFRPESIRSVNAAFDPAKADSPSLLAGGAAAAVGLGAATQGQDAEAGVITRGGKKMLEFWHGSPHKFDRFDMSKIGTGEGAQAYGHGLYGADSRDVARSYRENLTGPRSGKAYRVTVDGAEVDAATDPALYDIASETHIRGKDEMASIFEGEDAIDTYDDYKAAWERVKGAEIGVLDDGALYRVEADIDPDMLLDWDKPLSEQPEGVKRAFAQVVAGDDPLLGELFSDGIDATYLGVTDRSTGGQIYNTLSEGKQAELSARLNELGVPGIRYLDGMSRNAGEGSYNYVMFDDKPLRIAERGNINPTLSASMGAGSALAIAANEFQQRRQQKRSQWDSLRADLMDAFTKADQAIAEFTQPALEAIDMPWKGILGATRVAGGLAAGESFNQALNQGAMQARQPLEQTAYDLGGQVTDATGSPLAGAAVNAGVQMGGPI